ncbi:PucR family transcriptional regulator [Lentzea albida]|uniref:PucR C-terminal helix-turn-helix domain-containing protein n=1 Tax=Lentzea albida TaxID=65499 RepID=A0A1H9WUM4_9PSEU|nr:helix-turn-helix domain-containing protein [Lentzea albida]SES37093.1 PucR C-terminal helix-turn-helix domain-containing protein [Lentzea albida]
MQHSSTIPARLLAFALGDDSGRPEVSGRRWERKLHTFSRTIANRVGTGCSSLQEALLAVRRLELLVQREVWPASPAGDLASAAARSEQVAERCAQLRSSVLLLLLRQSGEHGTAERELWAQALLADPGTAHAVAEVLGTPLPRRWVVSATADAQLARHLAEPGHLITWHEDVWCVLSACTGPDEEQSARRAAGNAHPVVVGLAGPVRSEDLPDVVRQVAGFASLGSAGGLAGVVTGLDVVVEASVATDAEVSARVAVVMARLRAAGAHLVEALEALYDHDLSRTRAAQALGVHRSTLEYRLQRVRRLTGVCPTSTRGVLLFSTALTVVRARGRRRLAG